MCCSSCGLWNLATFVLAMTMSGISLYKHPEKEFSWTLLVSNSLISSLVVDTNCLFLGSRQIAYYVKDYFLYHTIRSASCLVLLPLTETRCSNCVEHRRTLNSMLHRHSKMTDSTDPTSHTNYRFVDSRIERCINFSSKL